MSLKDRLFRTTPPPAAPPPSIDEKLAAARAELTRLTDAFDSAALAFEDGGHAVLLEKAMAGAREARDAAKDSVERLERAAAAAAARATSTEGKAAKRALEQRRATVRELLGRLKSAAGEMVVLVDPVADKAREILDLQAQLAKVTASSAIRASIHDANLYYSQHLLSKLKGFPGMPHPAILDEEAIKWVSRYPTDDFADGEI